MDATQNLPSDLARLVKEGMQGQGSPSDDRQTVPSHQHLVRPARLALPAEHLAVGATRPGVSDEPTSTMPMGTPPSYCVEKCFFFRIQQPARVVQCERMRSASARARYPGPGNLPEQKEGGRGGITRIKLLTASTSFDAVYTQQGQWDPSVTFIPRKTILPRT
ncbi:hypothetical protein MKZ38_001693 [Zalerion maritima]|uniref:Uncharacterized protein n=1 Tax=Zalerion maritima TaxID=339359 RepID=A0AAD5WRR7_9PEZI|nr:hypothetical protein MKZ38_001693 [Zalerion maritima]